MMPELRAYMEKVTAGLRQKFAAERANGPRAFKEHAVRYLRLALGPGPGRPPKESVTLAVKMLDHGDSWREIYGALGYDKLSADERTVECLRLRSAVRSWRNAARRRRNSRHASTEKETPPDSFVLRALQKRS